MVVLLLRMRRYEEMQVSASTIQWNPWFIAAGWYSTGAFLGRRHRLLSSGRLPNAPSSSRSQAIICRRALHISVVTGIEVDYKIHSTISVIVLPSLLGFLRRNKGSRASSCLMRSISSHFSLIRSLFLPSIVLFSNLLPIHLCLK